MKASDVLSALMIDYAVFTNKWMLVDAKPTSVAKPILYLTENICFDMQQNKGNKIWMTFWQFEEI